MQLCYCFLEKFNNYFNRKVIKYDALLDYENNSKSFFIPLNSNGSMTKFNFNPFDNITTEIIMNDVPFDPDYFLLLDEEENIIQRWFVIEQKRERNTQWTYQLRRDVIADNLENLLDAPIFVEKGMLPENDKFILNDEGMNFNQIKKEELFIKDKSETAWIVGYLAKNTDGTDVNINIPAEDLSSGAISLSDIASALGTTEGVLTALLNFDEEINNYICFTNNIEFNIKLHLYEAGNSAISPYIFQFDSFLNFKQFNTYTYNAGNYLFTGPLGDPEAYRNFENNFPLAVISNKSAFLSQLTSIIGQSYYFNSDQYNILESFNGKIIYYNSKYYEINVVKSGSMQFNSGEKSATAYSSLENIANDTANSTPRINVATTPYYTDIGVYGSKVYISLNERKDFATGYNTTISASRIALADQEFDMFIIPFEDGVIIKDAANSINFKNNKNVALKAAGRIAQELGKDLYDIQLLPYCPLPEIAINYWQTIPIPKLIKNIDLTKNAVVAGEVSYSIIGTASTTTSTKTTTLNALTEGYYLAGHVGGMIVYNYNTWQIILTAEELGLPTGTELTIDNVSFTAGEGIDSYLSGEGGSTINLKFALTTSHTPPTEDCIVTLTYTYTTEIGTPASVIIYCRKSSFQVYNDYGIPSEINNSDISLKILSNAYYMRLCSPNYQGSFDVNIGKNNGKIKGYWLYGTYKPYTPYIKVAPLFESLYGQNFGDQRGLICSGDFSLPRIIDEWQNFQLNNKNYQNIFNREIQNMEFLQSIEMRNQLVSGAVGIVGDAAKGAGAGAMASGSPWGAVAGGIIGGAASAAGYAIDVDTLARTQREQKQLAIDKFNYQLGNIKALPYTLTNIGAFNINSKIYPFLEIYTPTEEELTAFRNKIKWESMTVMRIGTLREFMNFNNELNYFKGSLIRNNEIADDAHVVNVIYEELLKGVYV